MALRHGAATCPSTAPKRPRRSLTLRSIYLLVFRSALPGKRILGTCEYVGEHPSTPNEYPFVGDVHDVSFVILKSVSLAQRLDLFVGKFKILHVSLTESVVVAFRRRGSYRP